MITQCDERAVLDKGYVKLLSMTPHDRTGDEAVVSAARVSFAEGSKGEEKDRKLLRYLIQHKHTSPFEHVVYTFEVKAPALVWWQWVRHRMWSYNFVSGRYVDHDEDEVYVPNVWRAQSKTNRQGSNGLIETEMQQIVKEEMESVVEFGFRKYQRLLWWGVAREQARLVLPAWALYYRAICTVDLHNLMHFVRLRTGEDAQWEIAQYAHALWSLVRDTVPWIAEEFENDLERQED